MQKKAFIFVFIFLSLIGFVFALELPPEPMAFYGDVTYTNGTAIPNGYYLIAKLGTTIGGECEIINGQYGFGTNTCVVLKPSSTEQNLIEFYIGDNKIGEHYFQSKEIINLDFSTDSLPANFTPLSNGICEPLKGECSYNMLDCDASKTNICAGNGICDSLIGETCTFTPQDCGLCLYCGDGICNNGETCSTCSADCGTCPSGSTGGGGGGGGGGSSSGGKTTTTTPIVLTSSGTNSNSSASNTQNLSKKTDESSSSPITGRSISNFSDFATSGYGITIGIIIVVVLAFLAIRYVRKRKK